MAKGKTLIDLAKKWDSKGYYEPKLLKIKEYQAKNPDKQGFFSQLLGLGPKTKKNTNPPPPEVTQPNLAYKPNLEEPQESSNVNRGTKGTKGKKGNSNVNLKDKFLTNFYKLNPQEQAKQKHEIFQYMLKHHYKKINDKWKATNKTLEEAKTLSPEKKKQIEKMLKYANMLAAEDLNTPQLSPRAARLLQEAQAQEEELERFQEEASSQQEKVKRTRTQLGRKLEKGGLSDAELKAQLAALGEEDTSPQKE